jgi:mono/diheme cytochrome c family protein
MAIRLRTIGMLLLVAAAAAGAFLYAGIYNVAATEQHIKPVVRLLDYAMRQSVKLRAASVEAPDLSDAQHIRNGIRHYRTYCLQCHGAPGIAPDSLGFGMNPAPANLVATAREWQASEIYWVVRYGIRMTGMPAWEYRLSDQEIWDVVAFVEQLPAMSPKDFAALSNETASVPPPGKTPPVEPNAALPGNQEAGRRAITQYLCATCHQIPGLSDASKHVGAPLNGIATRKYIAGVLPNTPENMVRWLQNPKSIAPLTAMPNLSVTEKDARDIAAYLYTLEDLD